MNPAEEGISTVILGILATAKDENKAAFDAIAHEAVIQDAVKCALDANFEDFYFLLLYPIGKALDGLLEHVTHNEAAQFILRHSLFVESHFSNLIERIEGSPCSADKSRTIVQALLNFYMTGKEIAFNYDQDVTYQLPKVIFKTHDAIIEFAEGLRQLHAGCPKKYLAALAAVAKIDHPETTKV